MTATSQEGVPTLISNLGGACSVGKLHEARLRLRHSGYPALAALTCHIEGTTLVLEGRAPSYYMKQLAQTLVRDIAGIDSIENNVAVDRH